MEQPGEDREDGFLQQFKISEIFVQSISRKINKK